MVESVEGVVVPMSEYVYECMEDYRDVQRIPVELLHLADPSDEMLHSYLKKSIGFVCTCDQKIVGALLLTPTRPFVTEIMNVSVDESHQNRGIGRELIRRAVHKAKDMRMRKIEIGTGNPGVVQMLLYQKCGFRIVGVDLDYFRIHYKERIIENGIECRDMIRMEMILDANV